MRWRFEIQASALALAFALGGFTACQARSAEEKQISARYPEAFYMYAGAACKWQQVKRVEWADAKIDEGIHRWSVQNLNGSEEIAGAYELYTDDQAWGQGEYDRARSRGLPLKVKFSGWIAGCKDDPNEIAIADTITLPAEK
jgi:hypothetical protein